MDHVLSPEGSPMDVGERYGVCICFYSTTAKNICIADESTSSIMVCSRSCHDGCACYAVLYWPALGGLGGSSPLNARHVQYINRGGDRSRPL